MKKSFSLLSSSFLVWLILQSSCFAYSSDPEKFISEIIDDAKVILNSTDSKEEKAKKLSDIALKTVDIKGIGYYTLGGKRKELSPEQLKKYEEIFEKYFLKSFTQK